jgi:hypothetical protein
MENLTSLGVRYLAVSSLAAHEHAENGPSKRLDFLMAEAERIRCQIEQVRAITGQTGPAHAGANSNIEAAPVVVTKLTRDKRCVTFRCPHCKGPHRHGAQGIVDGANPHRVAHCWRQESPFRKTGYILTVEAPR